MKGTLDLIGDNDWVVRYRTEDSNGVIIYKTFKLNICID